MFTATSRRVLALVLTALAVVALAACGSSKKSSSSTSSNAADPATIAPARAPVYVEATVNPSANQKAAFNSLSRSILGVPNPGDKLVALIDKSGAKNGVTYEADIKPWLGDKIAVVATRLASGNGSAFAVIIATKNPQQAMTAVQKGQEGVSKGKIAGVSYVKTSDGSFAGTIGNYLVVGNRAGFAAVAAGQKGAKLADQPAFKAARSKAPADRLAYLYLNTDSLLTFAAKTNSTLQSQLGTFKGLFGNIRALSASLVATPTSIEIDATTVGPKTSSGGGASGPSALPLGKAPGDAWAAISLRNVGTRVTHLLTSLGNIGAASSGQNFQQILAQLKATTGLDVQQDLLSWMGDAGAFIRGTSTSDLGGAVVINSTDPAKSQAAVGKIATLLTKIGRSSQKIKVPGGTGIEFSSTQTGPPVQIAAVGSLFYIAFGSGALEDAMHPSSTLDSTANYQTAVASLKGATPSVYVDLQTIFGIVEQLSSSASLQSAKPYLDAFTSLIAGSSNGVYKIVLNVKPSSATSTTPTTPSTTPTTGGQTTASDSSTSGSYFPGG